MGVLVVLLVIAGLAAWGWWATRPKPVDVVVVKVERGTVEKTVANTRAGTVTACRRARLSPSTGGQIAVLPVKEGDQVKEGQLLLELWNKDIKAERALAEQEATSAAATARSICISADQARREAAEFEVQAAAIPVDQMVFIVSAQAVMKVAREIMLVYCYAARSAKKWNVGRY